jgi:hypothetical protein
VRARESEGTPRRARVLDEKRGLATSGSAPRRGGAEHETSVSSGGYVYNVVRVRFVVAGRRDEVDERARSSEDETTIFWYFSSSTSAFSLQSALSLSPSSSRSRTI